MLVPLLQAGVPAGPELFILAVITFLPLLVGVVVSVLVYRDAKRRNSAHAIAWALGSLLGGLIVWILYAVVRDEVGPGTA